MLVVFIYITSVTSNEKFTLKTKPLIIRFLVIFPLILINKLPKNFINNTTNFSNKTQEFIINKFINLPIIILIIIIIIYLLITLIATVKITKIKLGPLRQKY